MKLLKQLLFLTLTAGFISGCGMPGFTSSSNVAGGTNPAPTIDNPIDAIEAKPTGIEVVTGAGTNIVTQSGAKAEISVGDISKNKLKSANGYQVFLSISGQNSSQ